jgi:hypothetical protein
VLDQDYRMARPRCRKCARSNDSDASLSSRRYACARRRRLERAAGLLRRISRAAIRQLRVDEREQLVVPPGFRRFAVRHLAEAPTAANYRRGHPASEFLPVASAAAFDDLSRSCWARRRRGRFERGEPPLGSRARPRRERLGEITG